MKTSLTLMTPRDWVRHLHASCEALVTRELMFALQFALHALGSHQSRRVAQVLCVLMLPFGLAAVVRLPPLPKLQGSYTTVITPEDLPAGFGSTNLTADAIAFLSGEWQIDFIPDSHSDGHFTMTRNGEAMILNGRYALHNNTITFSDEIGPAACSGDPRPNYRRGTYRWGHSGNELAFLVTDDKCGGRMIVLGTRPWVKLR